MVLNVILTEPVILSGLGGLCYPFLAYLEWRNKKQTQRPPHSDLSYYISIIIYVFFALLIGYAYFSGRTEINKLLAIHIGISSPLILRTMSTVIPSNLGTTTGTKV